MRAKNLERVIDDLEKAILTQLEFAKESVQEEIVFVRDRIKAIEAGEHDRLAAKFDLIKAKVRGGGNE